MNNQSPFGNLTWADLAKGVALVALAAALMYLNSLGFSTGNPAVDGLVDTFIAYLVKQLATDKQGKLGGKI